MSRQLSERHLIGGLVAIIICSLVVGFLVIVLDRRSSTEYEEGSAVRPITADDHVIGARDADTTLIVYTDLECAYCKRFHLRTLGALREEYGDSIAIVYRHFPMPSRPKALPEAEAAECAYELGGHAAFWEYVQAVFSITPSDNQLDLAMLPDIARGIGLDDVQFEACRATGAGGERVARDVNDGARAGVVVTPSILVQKGDRSVLVAGDYLSRIQTAIAFVRSDTTH